MADKMMRIAGRGTDGKAKAIKTDDEGLLETKKIHERKLLGKSVSLQPYESFKTNVFDSLGYNCGNLTLFIGETRTMKISIIYRDTVGGVLYENKKVIYQGLAHEMVSVDYDILSKEYQFEITATSQRGLWIRTSSFETLYNNTTKENTLSNYKVELFDGYKRLNKNETALSDEIVSYGYNRARLNLSILYNQAIKIDILDLRRTGNASNYTNKRTIFEGYVSDFKVIYFSIFEELFQVEIKALESETIIMGSTNIQLMNDNFVVIDDGQLSDIKREVSSIEKAINNHSEKNINRPIKYPSGFLSFKQSPKDIQTLYKGLDGYFYTITFSGVLEKHETVVEDKDPLETGIVWDFKSQGEIMYLFVTPDGVVFFSNLNVDGKTYPRIYRSETIKDEPELVYEGDSSGSSRWTRHFGVDHYFNGTSYYLAGVYSSGDPKQKSRDLVLSTDGGKNFNVIKQTVNIDDSDSYNSHWHDVAIDPYHGLLWAVEGDGPINRHIWYSEDFGNSWEVLTEDEQPTTIIPYPDKIVFGRDGKNVGFDSLYFPKEITKLDSDLITVKREFKTQSAVKYFSVKPVIYKNETYANFFLFDSGHTPMVVASGDFGQTWHGVWFDNDKGQMYKLVAVDDKFLYAYNFGRNKIIYSEKPEWL